MNQPLIPENQKFTFKQFQTHEQINKFAQAGDIMLSSTNARLYQGLRQILGVQYDHISVYLGRESILHISWPKVRIIHSLQLVSNARDYKLIRPNFSSTAELDSFLSILQSNIDANYDFMQLFRALSIKLQMKYLSKENASHLEQPPWVDRQNSEIQLQRTQVCTDLVFYALSISCPRFRSILSEQIKFLQYQWIGSFSTEDLNYLVKQSDFFSEIYKATNDQNGYPRINRLSQIPSEIFQFIGQFNAVKQKVKSWVKSQNIESLQQFLNQFEHILVIYNTLSLVLQPTFEKVKDLAIKQFPDNKYALEFFYHSYSILRLYEKIKSVKTIRQMVFHMIKITNLIYQNRGDNIQILNSQVQQNQSQLVLPLSYQPYISIYKAVQKLRSKL